MTCSIFFSGHNKPVSITNNITYNLFIMYLYFRDSLLRFKGLRKFNVFIFVIIESKHIYYSLSVTHKIRSVLLRKIRLKAIIPDLLNWLCHHEQILPFSQVNYLSQCRIILTPSPPTPTLTWKGWALVKKAFNPILNFVLNNLYGVILCIVFIQLYILLLA